MGAAGALRNNTVDTPVSRPQLPESNDGRRFNAILDAAEYVFANEGFNGTSIREIASRAGVAQALIHYHFDNKEKLFEAMAARRSNAINNERARLPDTLLNRPEPPQPEQIVGALFRPAIEAGSRLAKDGGGSSRIQVSIANSGDPKDQELVERYYDPIAYRFIDAFGRAEPGLTRKDAVWANMFSIGVGMTKMAQTGRSARLSAGECDDRDIDAMLQEISKFICGGIRALSDQDCNTGK